MTIIICPSGFQIRSLADAKYFIERCVPRGCALDFHDVTSPRYYFELCVEKSGRVLFGRARCHKSDSLLSEPMLLDDRDVVHRLYKARKSLNARLRTKD